MTAAKDMSGQRFGRLVALSPQPPAGAQRTFRWLVRCDCGNEKVVGGADLRSGRTRSCGCLKAETTRARKAALIHGMSFTPTWHSWTAMRHRCNSPGHTHYRLYGGRGIKVCERWLDFSNFLADMGERPPGTSLDRWPDKDGNYEPGNCRWATPTQQARNQRSNKIVEINGCCKTKAEWCEVFGISDAAVAGRIKRGWPTELAFTVPIGGRRDA